MNNLWCIFTHECWKFLMAKTVLLFLSSSKGWNCFYKIVKETRISLFVCTDLGSLIGNTQCGNYRIFVATQSLREINFGHFEAPKTAILTIWADLNFKFLDIFDIFKCEIHKIWKSKASKIVKITVCDPMTMSDIRQIWFHVKLEWQENC